MTTFTDALVESMGHRIAVAPEWDFQMIVPTEHMSVELAARRASVDGSPASRSGQRF